MKTKPPLFVLLVILSIYTVAQSGKTETQKRNIIWLQNSEGQLVKTSKDTVLRSFFLVKQVTVHSQIPLQSEACFIVIIQPSDGSQPKAYSLWSAVLPIMLRKDLETAPIGTRVTFTIGNKKGGSSAGASMALSVILGP